MTRTRHAALLACAVAVFAPASSLARDATGTGLPAQTLTSLRLDRGFGRGGRVRSAASGGIRVVSFDRVALDPGGRIVVGGVAKVPGSGATRPCVARFLADGRLDRTFAGGIVTLPVSGALVGLAVDGAGRIVACGSFRGLPGTKRAETTFAAARLRADGRMDREFSDDGLAESDIADFDYALTSRIDPRDDSILILFATWYDLSDRASRVVRFTSAGALDTTFGEDGIAATNSNARNMAIDDRGGVIVSGLPMVRLASDGVRDMTFGGDGTLKGPLGQDVWGAAIQIDGRGRIVLAGAADSGGPAVFRFLADGTLDASFDGDGRSPVPLAVLRDHWLETVLLAATSGDVERYVLLAGLHFVERSGTGYSRDVGTGYVVQAVDPSNLGALTAFVHCDPRPMDRAAPALTDVVVTPDGSAAIGVGSETVGPRGRKTRTPLLFRVDLTPRKAVPLPDFRIEWTEQPVVTATGPRADGYVFLSGGYDGLTVRVTNDGATDLVGAVVTLRLSDDDRIDASDPVLGSSDTGSVPAGATVPVVVAADHGFFDANFTGLSGKHLIAVINPDGGRPESDTTDNVAVSDQLP